MYMCRAFIIFSGLFWTLTGLANPSNTLYQVDLILFTNLQTSPLTHETTTAPLLTPDTKRSIPLQHETSSTRSPYHLLPSSSSQLRNEYWAIHRKPQYQVLWHYTWLQPNTSQRPIVLSERNQGGWNIEGTMRIRRSNYYLLDTNLVFSTPGEPNTSFVFSQKQRLKPGVVYYLDHPQAGMLLKIHQVA